MKLSIIESLIAVFAIGLLLFLLRAVPFLVFNKRKIPAFFSFIEKYIPAISIAVLFVICLKEKTTDILLANGNRSIAMETPAAISAVTATVVTAVLHIWKQNAMVSIFGGTIAFMILNYFF